LKKNKKNSFFFKFAYLCGYICGKLDVMKKFKNAILKNVEGV